jgi:hypothetical protein
MPHPPKAMESMAVVNPNVNVKPSNIITLSKKIAMVREANSKPEYIRKYAKKGYSSHLHLKMESQSW